MEVINDLQEPKTEEQNQEQTKEKEYRLPDGFGMDLDSVQAMILKQCGVGVDKDDPVLMFVPILNAFLLEQQKMNNEYKEGLEKVYQSVLNAFLENLDKRIQNGELKVVTVQNVFLDNLCKFFSKNFFIKILLAVIFLQTFLMVFFLGR